MTGLPQFSEHLSSLVELPWGLSGKKKNLPANAGDLGLIPGSGRSPAEGTGNPLQYSYLGNPMDRGACSLKHYSSWGHKRVRHNLATKQPPPPHINTK